MSSTSTAVSVTNEPITVIANATPMMRQYLEIKSGHTDAILFYRLGDFYEMFYDDAIVASKLLSLTLTTRNKNSEDQVPLCGIPYHAAEGYIAKLIKLGKKVVVCEQTEDPKKAKGLVRREVTRVVSPGIILEDQSLSAKRNNFLLCIKSLGEAVACSVCDVSTGLLEYFLLANMNELADEISRLRVSELVYSEKDRNLPGLENIIANNPTLYHHAASDLYADADYSRDLIINHFSVSSLASLDLAEDSGEVQALGLLLGVLKENKILSENLLQQPVRRSVGDNMVLDENTLRNLEIFETLRDGDTHGTLIWHLDACATAMGSRLLADFIRSPLLDAQEIEARLSAVEEIVSQQALSQFLAEFLSGMTDLERLANKFVTGSANARDATALKDGLLRLPQIRERLALCASGLLKNLGAAVEDFSELAQRIEKTVVSEPGLSLRDGGIIAAGVSSELDELREIESNGKDIIAKMEASERVRTGISSLKIRYNNVFGYYIEITHAHADKVPKDYVRKQTLSNAERYITDELKTYEAKVLGAGDRIKNLEYEIFCTLREAIAVQCGAIKKTARAIAWIDVLNSFADVTKKFGYVRPKISNSPTLDLREARHPILERLNPGDRFVPNDIFLDNTHNSVMIITGPNMAGKSTLMRMTALVVVMAQIGCFVPCGSAHVGLCDRVFTRVGAHDHLQKGLSTFMVEMVETAKILREATARSLILLDEIGRGTSTFDGLSIAWAVAEDIHDRLGARTLFATHYHELCDLAEQKKAIKNFHMSVKEWNGQILFLRKLKSGGTNRSYGVAVAGMAGLPPATVTRAREILKLLELKDLSFQSELNRENSNQMFLFEPARPVSGDAKDVTRQFELIKQIRELDINKLTPIEALTTLAALKEEVQ